MIDLLEERRIALTDWAVLKERAPERPISALASYINGWAFKPGDFSDAGLPVVRIQQLTNPSAKCDFFDGPLPDRVKLRSGDIVFSWSASLEVRVWDRGPAYLNQHLFRVLPVRGVDNSWLRFALDVASRQFLSLMHGSAMTHITQPMMKLVRVPLPELDRQRQIADTLTREWKAIDEVSHRLVRQVALLRDRRQILICNAVTGQLDLAKTAA